MTSALRLSTQISLRTALAVGTVPVPAGILVEFHVPAFPARADIDTKSSGFAGKDCMGSFLLFF